MRGDTADPDHALSAVQAIVLNALAAMFILAPTTVTVFGVGPGPVILAGGYLLGTRVLFRHASVAPATEKPSSANDMKRSVGRPLVAFGAAALVVLAASPAFAWSAKGLAEASGLGTTFVGTLLVGLSTSLPEFVACLAAIRLGSTDLAVGNLFGSNAFNMAIFLLLDLAHPGALFAALDPGHALSGMLAVVLMGFGLAAVVYRRERRIVLLDPDSVMIGIAYVAGITWLYFQTARMG